MQSAMQTKAKAARPKAASAKARRNNPKQAQQPQSRGRATQPANTIGASYYPVYNPKALSAAAAAYARLVADPYNAALTDLPDFPSLYSAPRRVFARGTFTTSSAGAAGGFGSIVMMPELAVVNNQNFLLTNNPIQAATTIQGPGALAPDNPNLITSNAEYASAGFGGGTLNARIVAAGLRIRNVTGQLYRGGQITGLHEPSHTTLIGGTTAGLLAYNESGYFDGASTEWTGILWRPVFDSDTDYFKVLPAGAGISYYMGFVVQSPDASGANPQTYEYEAYVCCAYQGTSCRGPIPSPVDMTGFGSVSAVALQSRTVRAPSQIPSHELGQALAQASDVHVVHHTSGVGRGSVPAIDNGWSKVLDIVEEALPTGLSLLSSLLA